MRPGLGVVVIEMGVGERQVWVQEDGQIEIDIWEYDISETVIFFKGHSSEAIIKFSNTEV